MIDPQESAKVVLWLGESAGFWIQTVAIFLSAIAAVFVIHHNGVIAKRRATIDHIIHQKTDSLLRDSVQLVYDLHKAGTQFSDYLAQPDTPQHKAIFRVLNNHEFIALGIRRKAFDGRIYKEMQYSNFVKVYESSAGIIAELRKKETSETLFQEFEWLIKEWKKKPLKRHA